MIRPVKPTKRRSATNARQKLISSKKGQSGNPRGRRKGSKSFETLVREELCKKVKVKSDGKVKSLSVAQVLVIQTLREGIAGSRRAADQGLRLIERYGLFDESSDDDHDLTLLTDKELEDLDRILCKSLGIEQQRDEEAASMAAEAEAEQGSNF